MQLIKKQAGQYHAYTKGFHVEIDRIAHADADYYRWALFITRFDGPTPLDSDTITVVHQGLAHTRRDALDEARRVIDALLADVA